VNKPLHPSTNAEILAKIGPLGSELPGLECRPLKIKNKEKTLAKYIAISASLPSGLHNIASKSSVVFNTVYIVNETTISGIHVFGDSAVKLVRRGGIPSNLVIAYHSAKNYKNRLMCTEVIACNSCVVCQIH